MQHSPKIFIKNSIANAHRSHYNICTTCFFCNKLMPGYQEDIQNLKNYVLSKDSYLRSFLFPKSLVTALTALSDQITANQALQVIRLSNTFHFRIFLFLFNFFSFTENKFDFFTQKINRILSLDQEGFFDDKNAIVPTIEEKIKFVYEFDDDSCTIGNFPNYYLRNKSSTVQTEHEEQSGEWLRIRKDRFKELLNGKNSDNFKDFYNRNDILQGNKVKILLEYLDDACWSEWSEIILHILRYNYTFYALNAKYFKDTMQYLGRTALKASENIWMKEESAFYKVLSIRHFLPHIKNINKLTQRHFDIMVEHSEKFAIGCLFSMFYEMDLFENLKDVQQRQQFEQALSHIKNPRVFQKNIEDVISEDKQSKEFSAIRNRYTDGSLFSNGYLSPQVNYNPIPFIKDKLIPDMVTEDETPSPFLLALDTNQVASGSEIQSAFDILKYISLDPARKIKICDVINQLKRPDLCLSFIYKCLSIMPAVSEELFNMMLKETTFYADRVLLSLFRCELFESKSDNNKQSFLYNFMDYQDKFPDDFENIFLTFKDLDDPNNEGYLENLFYDYMIAYKPEDISFNFPIIRMSQVIGQVYKLSICAEGGNKISDYMTDLWRYKVREQAKTQTVDTHLIFLIVLVFNMRYSWTITDMRNDLDEILNLDCSLFENSEIQDCMMAYIAIDVSSPISKFYLKEFIKFLKESNSLDYVGIVMHLLQNPFVFVKVMSDEKYFYWAQKYQIKFMYPNPAGKLELYHNILEDLIKPWFETATYLIDNPLMLKFFLDKKPQLPYNESRIRNLYQRKFENLFDAALDKNSEQAIASILRRGGVFIFESHLMLDEKYFICLQNVLEQKRHPIGLQIKLGNTFSLDQQMAIDKLCDYTLELFYIICLLKLEEVSGEVKSSLGKGIGNWDMIMLIMSFILPHPLTKTTVPLVDYEEKFCKVAETSTLSIFNSRQPEITNHAELKTTYLAG